MEKVLVPVGDLFKGLSHDLHTLALHGILVDELVDYALNAYFIAEYEAIVFDMPAYIRWATEDVLNEIFDPEIEGHSEPEEFRQLSELAGRVSFFIYERIHRALAHLANRTLAFESGAVSHVGWFQDTIVLEPSDPFTFSDNEGMAV